MKKRNYLKSMLIIIVLINSCQKEDSFIEFESLQKDNIAFINSKNASRSSSLTEFSCESSNYKYDYNTPSFTVGERDDLLWGINGHSLRPDYTGYENPYNAIDFQKTINLLKKTGLQIYRNDIHVGIDGSLAGGEDDSQLNSLIALLTQEEMEFLPMIYTNSYVNFLDDNSSFQYSSIKNSIKFLSNLQVQNIVSNTQIWTSNYSIGHQIGRNFAIQRGNEIKYYNVGNENAYRIIRNINGIGFGNDLYSFFSSEDRAKHIVGSTAFTKGVIDGIKEIKSDAVCFTTETAAVFGYFDFFNLMDVQYDAIGWNWYSGFGKIQNLSSGNEHVGLTGGFNLYEKLNDLTNNKPIWLTEINRTHGSSINQNFDAQANYIRESMEEMYQLSNIKSYIIYELLDGSNGSSSNEDYFGLITNPVLGNYDLKPAYNAYRYSIEEFNYGYHDFMFSYYTLYRGDNRNIQNDTGIDYWATRFMEGLEISNFLELYMEVDAGNFVDDTYLLLLDRSSDPSGRSYYLNQLQNNLTREWVMADIISSDSFLNRANNVNYNGSSSDENFIYHVYSKLIGRTPTNEEISEDYFTDSTRDRRRNYALSFLNRSEYITKFITEQYGIYFNRAPDVGELQYHVSQWVDQKDFLIKIMVSNEFWRKSVIRGNCERQ